MLLDGGVCLPLNKGKEVNLTRNHKSIKPLQIKTEREQVLRFFPEKPKKKIYKTHIRVLTTFITPPKQVKNI